MSKETDPEIMNTLPVSRRRFVQGVAAGAAIVAYDLKGFPAFGETVPHNPEMLSGKHFELTIDSLPVNFTGRRAVATAVNGSVPGPILRWKEGDTVWICRVWTEWRKQTYPHPAKMLEASKTCPR